jgi:hypothetical protein
MRNESLILILNLENSGIYNMTAKIFESISDAHEKILENNIIVRTQFLEHVEKYAKEYRASHRSDIFFGSAKTGDVREKSFEYGIAKALKLFNACDIVENQVYERFSRLPGQASKEFLKAMKDILNPTNRGGV